jgi:nitrogenase molybdenum-iron protein alpha chain
MKRPKNPFLPKVRLPPRRKQSIAWRTGPAAGTVGIPALEDNDQAIVPLSDTSLTDYSKDPRGRKPKKEELKQRATPAAVDKAPTPRAFPDAGMLNFQTGGFFTHGHSGWGSNLDMMALAHGPVGCGTFAQTSRLNLPGFVQGIESFIALHACTNLTTDDLEDGGDGKLCQALDEIETLFPLARGTFILNQDSIDLIDTAVKGIAKVKTKEFGKPIIPPTDPWATHSAGTHAAALKAAAKYHEPVKATPYDVAVPFFRQATGLLWIVSKLLCDIGLNPVHVYTGSSTSDMARIRRCKFVIAFLNGLDPQNDTSLETFDQRYGQWFSMQPIWTCFLGPTATDRSLRAIAEKFGPRVQKRAEQVIAANHVKVEAVIARYRPRLEGKLVLTGSGVPEGQLEAFHLLGMRVGNERGWPGKTGVWRTPRLVCDWQEPRGKAFASYVAEAKPDYVYNYRFDEFDWKKRGLPGLAFSPFYDRGVNFLWGYDTFLCFVAMLDREVNAP